MDLGGLRLPWLQAIGGRLYISGLTNCWGTRHLATIRMLNDLNRRSPLPDLDLVIESNDM